MLKEEKVAHVAEVRTGPPPVQCSRGHRHSSDEQIKECDSRLAKRERLKIETTARLKTEAK